jgi:hypothetical protein
MSRAELPLLGWVAPVDRREVADAAKEHPAIIKRRDKKIRVFATKAQGMM